MASSLAPRVSEKLDWLHREIHTFGSALIAFSGGVDSALVARIAHDELGDNAVAVTASAWIYPKSELAMADEVAAQIGIRHETLDVTPLLPEAIRENAPDRCYFCKRTLFGALIERAKALGLDYLLDGSNADDATDYRPGARAVAELGVRSPLKEAGLSKAEIRQISRHLNMTTWDHPSVACLASRFPYGTAVTEERAGVVDDAEDFLRSLGFEQVRVRSDGTTARIEVPAGQLEQLACATRRGQIVRRLKELGFKYVSADLQGYRTGSMNETLQRDAGDDDNAGAGV